MQAVAGGAGTSPQQAPALGPHRLLASLDGRDGADAALSGRNGRAPQPAPQYYLAHSEPLGRPVVLLVPPARLAADPGFRVRFFSEASTSARLAGPAAAPVAGVAPQDDPQPWVAYDCAPALPLPAALAVHGGPLPVPYVCALGVALAGSVLQAHAQGLVYAGLTPDSVLLTPAGPRLTGYGAVRSTAPGDAPRTAVPGLPAAWLPPEQQAGGVPRPLGDVYAVGAVLAYAATGAAAPDAAAVPEPLRDVVAGCLAVDAAQRPRADALLAQLQQVEQVGQVGQAQRMQAGAAGAAEAQLPAAVAQALAAQLPAVPRQPAPPPGPPGPPGPAGPDTAAPDAAAETAVPPPRPTRRAVLTGLAFGAAGLAVGAGATYAWRRATADEPKEYRTTPAPGAPPKPLWRFDMQGQEASGLTLAGPVVVVETMGALTAVDLRTGKEAWQVEEFPDVAPVMVGRDLLVFPALSTLHFVSVREDGKPKGDEDAYAGSGSGPGFQSFVASRGNTLWMLLQKDTGATYYIAAYDVKKHKELWRAELPPGYGSLDTAPVGDGEKSKLRGGELLIPRQPLAEGDFGYLALDPATGDERWERRYEGVKNYDGTDSYVTAADRIVIPRGDEDKLAAFELRGGKRAWERPMKEHFSAALTDARSRVLYGTEDAKLAALDVRSGKRRWRVPIYSGGAFDVSDVVLSHSGRTVFYSNDAEVQAFDARDGSPRWRFATVSEGGGGGSVSGEGPGVSGRVLGAAEGMVLVLAKDALYALPVD